jgi:hypothetical protein
MDILKKLDMFDIDEAFKRVIRGGKLKRKLICPTGFKAKDGRCVKMGQAEIRKRSKSAKKAQKKLQQDSGKVAKMQRKKAKSLRKRAMRLPAAATQPGKQSDD